MTQTITLQNATVIPKLGQGTWYMGEPRGNTEEEIATLRRGVELGLNLIDTAEMYGNGRSEQLVGKAITGLNRQNLILVSKVLPENAGKKQLERSLDTSLKNMNTDYLDLYLLHWKGSIPLSETIECMELMVKSGKIKGWGVSNFDTEDMKELLSLPNGNNCQVNQVLYHLGSRGVEFNLLPFLTEKKIPLMAYCPLAQGGDLKQGLLQHPCVETLAKKYQVTPTTILLAFTIQEDHCFAVPKTSSVAHVEENAKALTLAFSPEDTALLRSSFPRPTKKEYLDIV